MENITIQRQTVYTHKTLINFELTKEKIQRLPGLFKNFHGVQDFHDAFFDTSHEFHGLAHEILENVLRPDQIYDEGLMEKEIQWVSNEDAISPTTEGIIPKDLW